MTDLRDKISEICCQFMAGPPNDDMDQKCADSILEALPDYEQQQARTTELAAVLTEVCDFFCGDPASDDFEAHAVLDKARGTLKDST
jgi:hypothetical protein